MYGQIEPSQDWYKLNYDDSSYVSILKRVDLYIEERWITKTSGTEPIGATGSDASYFRKWIDWKGEDIWLKVWEGYSGECFVNEQKVGEQNLYLSKYLKPGKNLIACYIQGPGRDGIMSYFYGNLITVSENQIAWSNNWVDWYLTEKPVNTGTEAKYYYCFNDKEHDYGCFWNSAWPWSSGETVFRKTFYLDSTNNSYLLVGTNLLDSSINNRDHFWCSVNGGQTDSNSLVGFDKNTHEKYNLKADISSKVKLGLNTITCRVSTYADPNPYQGGYKKFDMSFVQTPENPEIIGLKDYTIPIDDPTVTALVLGSGNTTVYAELLKGTRVIDKSEMDILLTGTGTVNLTLDVLKDSAALSNNNIWKYYNVNHLNPTPSSDWYKIDFNAELWEDVNMPTSAGGGPAFIRKIFYLERQIDLKLKAWDGYAGYCFINENRVDGQNIQIGQYLRAGENVIACSIWGPGRDGITTTFYGEPTPPPSYTILSNSLGDWFIVNSTESSILSLTGPGKYSVKITAVYNDYGISKTKDYNLEFVEPVPEYVPVNNPFVQSGGGGSESSNTNSSGSVPIVPLAVGLTGAAAIGAGYLATRPNKRYGKPSLGPGERLKTFWDNTAKEEKYYNEVRVPEIRKRQAEIEAIIKGFEEKARKKKEAEELEKITERMAWLNKAMLAGQLSTMQASKELRLMAGSPGIGVEAAGKLLNASAGLIEKAKRTKDDIERTSITPARPDLQINYARTKMADDLASGFIESWYETGKELVYDLPVGIYNWATTSKDRWGDIANGLGYIANSIGWAINNPSEAFDVGKGLLQETLEYCNESYKNVGKCHGEAVLFMGGWEGIVGKAGSIGKVADATKGWQTLIKEGKVLRLFGKDVEEASKLGLVRRVDGALITDFPNLLKVWKENPELVGKTIGSLQNIELLKALDNIAKWHPPEVYERVFNMAVKSKLAYSSDELYTSAHELNTIVNKLSSVEESARVGAALELKSFDTALAEGKRIKQVGGNFNGVPVDRIEILPDGKISLVEIKSVRAGEYFKGLDDMKKADRWIESKILPKIDEIAINTAEKKNVAQLRFEIPKDAADHILPDGKKFIEYLDDRIKDSIRTRRDVDFDIMIEIRE